MSYIIPKTKNTLILALKKQLLSKQQNFGKGDFYQSYEPLQIKGMRKTEARFNTYGLEYLLNKEQTILDIGCNCGFFSIYVAKHVKEVDAFDSNSSLIKIAKLLEAFVDSGNTNFTINNFIDFETKKKYNVVFALAIHKWLPLCSLGFCKKIQSFVKPNGIILLESHRLNKNNIKYKDTKYNDICRKFENLIRIKSGIIKDTKIEREFSIWKKV